MKIIHFMFTAVIAAVFASCDEHIDFPDTAMKIGDIVCTDGAIVRYDDVKPLKKTPVAVVFYINQNEDVEGKGYAVYLDDYATLAYSDSLGITHKTSADLMAYDGNSNTHAMYSTGTSPAATMVIDMWPYGQSAYIPSVAQMRLLFIPKMLLTNWLKSVEEHRYQMKQTSVGIGLRQRCRDRKQPKHGSILLEVVLYRKHPKYSHTRYALLSH